METKVPVCPRCGRNSIYFRKDGSVRCTKCGYDSQIERSGLSASSKYLAEQEHAVRIKAGSDKVKK